MITKTTHKINANTSVRNHSVNANRGPITASVRNNQRVHNTSILANSGVKLSPEKQAFARQLTSNVRRNASITAATNTSNIMARPDFLELLPMFVQQLLVLDVFGSVAMKSRQQLIPYFKFVAENTKGATHAGDVLSSPFANRQGADPNFTGRAVKNEIIGDTDFDTMYCAYTPILPGSVTVYACEDGESTPYTDDGTGYLYSADGEQSGTINYTNGNVILNDTPSVASGNCVKCCYQYDNETVGPDEDSKYGAKMGKGYLQLDEINLIAEAHELACYWSIYSAFVSQQEYGGNIADMAKQAAFSELTAEINTAAFDLLAKSATLNPAFNWDAAPVHSGSVVPSDYLNMFKLKLSQAAASIYQRTRLTRPNRIVCGTNVAEYIGMINGFQAQANIDTVGPYHKGTLDEFEIYVAPDYNPDMWVMCCKSDDIRRNSALFGEYMPMMNTDTLGMANLSVQQGYATMYATKIVNAATIVSGKIVGSY